MPCNNRARALWDLSARLTRRAIQDMCGDAKDALLRVPKELLLNLPPLPGTEWLQARFRMPKYESEASALTVGLRDPFGHCKLDVENPEDTHALVDEVLGREFCRGSRPQETSEDTWSVITNL